MDDRETARGEVNDDLEIESVRDSHDVERELPRKSMVLAYVLWFLLGGLGAHRFYLSRHVSALVYVALTLGMVLGSTPNPGASGILAFLLILYWVFDLFCIPRMVRIRNSAH